MTATTRTLTVPNQDGTIALLSDIAGASLGDVVGPSSATDNAIARFDTTTGKLIQNSGVLISDSNHLTCAGNWQIYSSSGDLLITAQDQLSLNSGYGTDAPIQINDGDFQFDRPGNIFYGAQTWSGTVQTITGEGPDTYDLYFNFQPAVMSSRDHDIFTPTATGWSDRPVLKPVFTERHNKSTGISFVNDSAENFASYPDATTETPASNNVDLAFVLDGYSEFVLKNHDFMGCRVFSGTAARHGAISNGGGTGQAQIRVGTSTSNSNTGLGSDNDSSELFFTINSNKMWQITSNALNGVNSVWLS